MARSGPGAARPPCEECGELRSHDFRSADDLLHALQVAAAEVDRGALRRLAADDLSTEEQRALDSIFESSALPDMVRYRFRCTVCGAHFELLADTVKARGSWTRKDPEEDR